MARPHFIKSALRLMIMTAPLALMACADGPGPMPTGYTYHSKLYKSPPGADASKPREAVAASSAVTVDNSALSAAAYDDTAMDYSAAPAPKAAQPAFIMAADDLITRTENNFGRLKEPVLVRAPGGNMADAHFAAALDEVLMRKGYQIARSEGDGPYTLDYLIGAGQFDDPNRNMVTLDVYMADARVWQESGIYTLPVSSAAPSVQSSYVLPATSAQPVAMLDAPSAPADEYAASGAPVDTTTPGVEVYPIE